MSARGLLISGVVLTLLLIVSAGAVATFFIVRAMERDVASSEARARADYAEPLALIGGVSNLAFDPNDEEALIAGSEEVFVGKVRGLRERADNEPMPFLEGWSPTARFEVEVEEVRKDASPGDGLAPGRTVTVNEVGSPLPDTKATICFGNQYPDGGYVDAQRLREGQRYVFATEYHSRKGWHELRVSPFGWMVLSDDAPPDAAPEAGDDRPPCPALYVGDDRESKEDAPGS